MWETLWRTLDQPLFWLCLSMLYYWVGQTVNRRCGTPLLNPLLITVALLGLTMGLTGTTLAAYNEGGRFLTMFLTPVTVALAVPIYRRFEILKKNLLPILCGAVAGSLTSMVSVFALCRLFGLTEEVTRSLLPKSVTTPIGIRISQQIGGLPSLTAVAIIITGIVGAIVLPTMLRLLHLHEPVAVGVAMGTSAHAFGTARALQLGETEGAMAGLSLGIAGIVTAVLASLLQRFL